jgi:hypothetical protein
MSRIRSFPTILIAAALLGCGSTGPTAADLPLEPSCGNRAALSGNPADLSPRYIVAFHQETDARRETARLAATYGFRPERVFAVGFKGFAADLTPAVLGELRCEPAVDFVEYNQRYYLD